MGCKFRNAFFEPKGICKELGQEEMKQNISCSRGTFCGNFKQHLRLINTIKATNLSQDYIELYTVCNLSYMGSFSKKKKESKIGFIVLIFVDQKQVSMLLSLPYSILGH
jgi:hypothetical protein